MPGESGRTETRLHQQSVPAEPGPLRRGTRPGDYAPQGPQKPQAVPSYYDVSLLKAPVWKWEIASYFFLGGVAGGALILARMAERFGGRQYRDLTRVGTFVAGAAIVPCAPLLIHDLGDRSRFHHMLRLFKPSTPMNLGTWVMTSFSGMAGVAVLREWAKGRRPGEVETLNKIAEGLRDADRAIVAVTDLAGVPLGLLLIGYTGVLLSCSANPLWSKNPWLGPLFSASAISTGAAATSLACELSGSDPEGPSVRALEKIDTAAHVAEAVTLAGYLNRAGPLAEPLTKGSIKKHMWGAVAGIAAAEVLKHLPVSGPARRWCRRLAALIGLGAGYSLRWAFVYGAHESGNNPTAARIATGTGGKGANVSAAGEATAGGNGAVAGTAALTSVRPS